MTHNFFRSPEMVSPPCLTSEKVRWPPSPLAAGKITVVRKLLLVTAATALRPPVCMRGWGKFI